METLSFHDGSITDLMHTRTLSVRPDMNHRCQMHSSLIRRLSLEPELEGHEGCVNAVAWNSTGSLLISGSDDTHTHVQDELSLDEWAVMMVPQRSCGSHFIFNHGATPHLVLMNIWSYSNRKLLYSIDTGHTQNIFCTKFVPETSDEVVVSGAGDAEVRVFNLSRLKEVGSEETDISPSALFQCHTKRVKKLAVEVGNPNVVWSASEDGTLRQHDFREGSSCPPAGSSHQECRNILLDLRCGAKKSLADPPRQSFALKSCDISTTRPHLLLVGGSDAFARLYDRRMLPPLSSCRKKNSPPLCVNYFCPMHLSNRGPSSWHLTHVAFSADGEEVLLNYSGEHAYLMDLNPGRESGMQYTVGDALKLYSYSSVLDGVELKSAVSGVPPNGSHKKSNISAQIDKCRELVKFAQKSLRFEKDIYYAIEACNEVLEIHNQDEIGSKMIHECLCIRAGLLLKRNWKNDVQVAIRDLHRARKIESNSVRALTCMSEALSQLGKHKEALEFGYAAQSLVPSDSDVAEMVETLRQELSAAEDERRNKAKSGGRREGQALSLTDILYRSEANSDTSQGGRSEGEESDDYNNDDDDDMALDFETSLSGDEERYVDSSFRHGSLNLRIHKRDESTSRTSGSVASSTTSSIKDTTSYQPETAIDMKKRFVGHCNVGTDIKQASFIGQRGEYVAAGSDDGRWFIWEKKTGRLIKMLTGDRSVVNCIQCHPYDCVIATSGIDNTIKLWSPTASVPSIVASGAAGPETGNALEAMEKNQRRLSHNREAMLPFELLERFRVHEFTEGSLHPFECTQS